MRTNKLPSPVSLFIILMLALGLNGCTAEMQNEELSSNATLLLSTNLNTQGNVDGLKFNESSIKQLRVLVYEVLVAGENTQYGDLIGNSSLIDPSSNDKVTLKVEFEKRNQVKAFLIANEDPKWNLKSKTYTVAELKKLTIEYGSNIAASTIAAPFKMYESTDIFSGQRNASRVVSLIRNVARVDVELTCNVADMTNMTTGGKLQLTQARILKMAKTTQLGEAIEEYTFGKGGYVDGPIILFKEGENYKTIYDKANVFAGFTTLGSNGEAGSLTFYVPEHFVKEVGTHTYMAIEGKYYPPSDSNGKGFSVAYTLPIGERVTTEKITGIEAFTPADLKITRNFLYEMKANIKKVEQISEVAVSVREWTPISVDGNIEEDKSQYSLNVSSLHTSLVQDTTLVQFWSNQPSNKVRVLPSGSLKKRGVESSEPFSVNSIFVALTDTEGQEKRPANLWFNDTTAGGQGAKSWGHLKLILQPEATGVAAGNVYTITLAAGVLHRTIKIEIPSAVLKEDESK